MQWKYASDDDYAKSIYTIEGDYPGKVISAIPKNNSTNGDLMLELKIELEYPTGEKKQHYYWLHDSPSGYINRKNFWLSAGRENNINASPSDYLGREVIAKTKVNKDISKGLKIVDFVPKSNTTVLAMHSTLAEDDIPF